MAKSAKSTFRVQPRSTRTQVSGRFVRAVKSVSGKTQVNQSGTRGKTSKK